MQYFTAKKFSFHSNGLPEDTFGVIHFKGSEGISRLYEFEIMLVSNNLEIDFEAVMQNRAKLIFHRPEGNDAVYNGIIAHFEQLHEVNGYAFYKAHLVPKLWWLSVTRHNQIILDKSVPDFIEDVLTDGGLVEEDFEFRLMGTYEPVEYVCQYNESHLNFISRWLEREGIYYFFEQTGNSEKVIFTDSMIAHTDLPQEKKLTYSPPSGLDSFHMAEVIKSFHCRQSLLPSKIFMKDYNYRKPSLDITGDADVDGNGRGTVYYYHGHIRSSEEGKRLAKIRAESLLCRKEEYRGEGSVPFMLPGFTFFLSNHFRKSFNKKYLITDIIHEGDQTGYLVSGISTGSNGMEKQIYYKNSFTAIPANVQFRPEVKAEQPRISGTIVGKIDAAGSGKYAELDEYGRYKIILPFDLSGRGSGKASAWIRMAQPYAGSDHGMHFPLHKGTEVLITFIDGDPDRPIIASAVPNPDTPSPVNANNQTMSVIQTAGQNKIAIEDKEGSERILLHSPKQGSYVRIGAPNDPPPSSEGEGKTDLNDKEHSPESEGEGNEGRKGYLPDLNGKTLERDKEHWGIHLYTNDVLDIEAATKNEVILGECTEWVGGISSEFVAGAAFDTVIGERMETSAIAIHEFSPTKWSYSAADTELHEAKTTLKILENKVDGVINAATQTINRVTDTKLQALNLDTRLHDLKTEVTNQLNAIIEAKMSAYATKEQLTAVKQEAIAEATKAVGNQTRAIGENVIAAASDVRAQAETMLTGASDIKALAEELEAVGSETRTVGETVTMAGLVGIL